MIFFVNEVIYHQSMTMKYDYHLCMNTLFKKNPSKSLMLE